MFWRFCLAIFLGNNYVFGDFVCCFFVGFLFLWSLCHLCVLLDFCLFSFFVQGVLLEIWKLRGLCLVFPCFVVGLLYFLDSLAICLFRFV